MREFKRYGAVIFDFDGTLYDNTGITKELLLSHPLSVFKIGADREARLFFRGMDFESTENFIQSVAERAGKKAGMKTEKFIIWFIKRYMFFLEQIFRNKRFHARPKIEECFESFNSHGVKIAVYSDYPNVVRRMKKAGISDRAVNLCEGLYSSETFGCLKPASRGYLQIAADLHVRPEDVLVIGDRDDTDGEGARMAGMDFLQVKTNKKPKPVQNGHIVIDWNDFVKKVVG